MKFAGIYLLGYVILIGVAIGIGIMVAVSSSGNKENIEIDRK